MKSAPNRLKTLSPNGQVSMLVGHEVEEHIRRRAYEIYEQRGREEGRHLEHWLQAEQELLGKQSEKRAK